MSIHALISRLDVSTDTEYEKLLSTFTLIKYTTTVPIKVLYLPGGYSLIDQGIAVQQLYTDLDVDELLYPDDDVQLITLKDLSKVQYGPVMHLSREEYVAIQNSRHNMQAIEQNVLKKYSYPKLDVTHITARCNMRL